LSSAAIVARATLCGISLIHALRVPPLPRGSYKTTPLRSRITGVVSRGIGGRGAKRSASVAIATAPSQMVSLRFI
jgi:hypothetical protein